MHGDKTQMGDDNGVEDVHPQNAFYGNGVQKGPAVVMTDDSMTEMGAMKTMWPSGLPREQRGPREKVSRTRSAQKNLQLSNCLCRRGQLINGVSSTCLSTLTVKHY